MGNGVEFVKSCFKERAKVVQELIARSEGFRDLCDDFEIADNEEERWELSIAPERNDRIALAILQQREGRRQYPLLPRRDEARRQQGMKSGNHRRRMAVNDDRNRGNENDRS